MRLKQFALDCAAAWLSVNNTANSNNQFKYAAWRLQLLSEYNLWEGGVIIGEKSQAGRFLSWNE